jgi:nicotinate-nucleotide--dimethylbenzimidazole phosphoribosyltransferase
MSVDGWKTLLVLGGTGSGSAEFAGSLVPAVTVRHLRCAPGARPAAPGPATPTRTVEEVGAHPGRLAEVIAAADGAETLVVDDLGDWVAALLDAVPASAAATRAPTATDHPTAPDEAAQVDGATQADEAAPAADRHIAELAAALRASAARVVLVSPEAGLTGPAGRPAGFLDALGEVNRALAAACDTVLLVVAGQPVTLKSGTAPQVVPAGPALSAARPLPGTEPVDVVVPAATVAAAADAEPEFRAGMDLPLPDEHTGPAAFERLGRLDIPGTGLGELARVVHFAAATQRNAVPTPWRSVRMLLLRGDHEGGASAGTAPGESDRLAAQVRAGQGVLARLAAEVNAAVQVIDAPTAAPMEHGPVLTAAEAESALRHGWRLAAAAAADGVDLLVLGSIGTGTDAAAAAVLAACAGGEASAVLDRVVTRDGRFDDAAWMIRCAAVRDALRRSRRTPRSGRDVLTELAGGDVAVATGVLLGAAAARIPVLLDGPIGITAGLVSRDFGGQARHWCLLPDTGRHPGVRLGAEVLGLTPLLDLGTGLGEGANALAVLPLLRHALLLAATLAERPSAAPGTDEGQAADIGAEFVEPTPAGPGPTTVDG